MAPVILDDGMMAWKGLAFFIYLSYLRIFLQLSFPVWPNSRKHMLNHKKWDNSKGNQSAMLLNCWQTMLFENSFKISQSIKHVTWHYLPY